MFKLLFWRYFRVSIFLWRCEFQPEECFIIFFPGRLTHFFLCCLWAGSVILMDQVNVVPYWTTVIMNNEAKIHCAFISSNPWRDWLLVAAGIMGLLSEPYNLSKNVTAINFKNKTSFSWFFQTLATEILCFIWEKSLKVSFQKISTREKQNNCVFLKNVNSGG